MVEISKDTERLLGTVAAIGTGFFAWEYQATLKWTAGRQAPAGYGLLSKQRFGDALAGLIGKGPASTIVPGWGGSADFNPHWNGVLNKTTFAGIGVLIADQVLQRLFKMWKTDLDAIPEIVRGVGAGLAIGGAIGGIFDPGPGGFTIAAPGPSGQVASGNVPFFRGDVAGGGRLTVLQ